MSAPGYTFVTRWRVEGTCGEVADLIGDPLLLPRWWPSVYLSVEELSPPGPGGVGRRVRLRTKGWLPYTLGWELVVVESSYPHGFRLEASGDLVGRGVWTFRQDGPDVAIEYDWRVDLEKAWLRRLSPLLRPLLEANHRWAMAQGEQSLVLELARRRATTPEAQAAIPPPPGPVTLAGAGLLAAGIGAVAGLAWALAPARSRKNRRRRGRPRIPGA